MNNTRHTLPELGFSADELGGFLSAETLELHHGKHHQGYVDGLNEAIEGTELQDLGLMELVRRSSGGTFDKAGQHFNHSFYWRCIAPGGSDGPSGDLLRAIESRFGSPDKLKEAFTGEANDLFGSGWCWLVRDSAGALHIRQTSNADTPVVRGEVPLLTCDVWEHAYYVDYRNERGAYVDDFWKAIQWDFAARCFAEPRGIEEAILNP